MVVLEEPQTAQPAVPSHPDFDEKAARKAAKRVARAQRKLRKQERRNDIPEKPRLRGWIHTVVVPLSLAASIVLLVLAPTTALRWACTAYLVSTLLLFGVSAMYHRIPWNPTLMALMRRWDHSNIFVLIAGSYTPIGVALLDARNATIMLSVVWAGAIIGVGISIFWPSAPRYLYVPIYIVLGWTAVFFLPQMVVAGGWAIVWLLISEGICYTLGALVYAFRWPDPSPRWFGFHEIFHAFTVAGWACHCVATYLAVLAV